jgi:hypothetical protein
MQSKLTTPQNPPKVWLNPAWEFFYSGGRR